MIGPSTGAVIGETHECQQTPQVVPKRSTPPLPVSSLRTFPPEEKRNKDLNFIAIYLMDE